MTASFPIIARALKVLGASLRDARKRRSIKTEQMAERMGVTRATLARMEGGHPTVGMETYAKAIYIIDRRKLEVLANLFADDRFGQIITDRNLPKRIRGRAKI